jgi:hypothetical protein
MVRNNRWRVALTSILVGVVAAVVISPASARASTRSDAWRTRAATALAAFEAADDDSGTAFAYAYAAATAARLRGWTDPSVTALLAKVYARQNPDGGYGLGYANPGITPGTTDPATTTYTITLAGHVGPVLLEGYLAGVVPAAKITTIVNLLGSMPQINNTNGSCLAYSANPNDIGPNYCVHNVNAYAAWFLHDAHVAGFDPVPPPAAGVTHLIAQITRREVWTYRTASYWWPYMDTSTLGDTDHNSGEVEAIAILAYPVTVDSGYYHMTHALADNYLSPIAHMRLTSLPRQPGSPDWCALGEAWTTEFDAFLAAIPTHPTPLTRYGQAGYYASRNAMVC